MKKLYLLLLLLAQQFANAQPVVQWQKAYGGGNTTATEKSVVQTTDGGYIVAGSSAKNGERQASLKKLDAAGNIAWQKTYGGTWDDNFNSVQQTSDGGYIALGESYSNDGDVSGHHGASANNPDFWLVKADASGNIQWQKSYGGTNYDFASCVIQTSDGGYILSGGTQSTDGDVTGHHPGYYDAWIVKIDGTGTIQWQKALGGSADDFTYYLQQTTDGGYILAGYSASADGDVSGFHGGYADYWIVKINSAGTIQWQKCLGGLGADYARCIKLTTDGGYIVAGTSTSNDGDVTGHHGTTSTYDYWIAKLDGTGTIQWQKSFGGTRDEDAFAIQQTTDGGYIVGGSAISNDGDVTGVLGRDAWIVKINSTGTLTWQKKAGATAGIAYDIRQTADGNYVYAGYSNTLIGVTSEYRIEKLDNTGGSLWVKKGGASQGDEYAYSVQQTSDGGYIMAGDAITNDGDVSGLHGDYDFWVVKTNAAGAIQWQKTLGGTSYEYAYSVQQTTDGGYIVAGLTGSNDGDVSGNHGFSDAWVVKLDASGNMIWQKAYGGTGTDYFKFIQQTSNGGYIMAGITSTNNNGDVSGYHGTFGFDYWVVKINSTGAIQWQKCLGGTGYDYAYCIKTTSDGGYIVAGDVLSNDGDVSGNHGSYDYWLVKLDGTGNITWQKTYGGTGEDDCHYVQQTSDGGYIAAGFSASTNGDVTGNHGGFDYWVIKTDASGTLQWQKSLGGTAADYAYSIRPTTDGGYIVAGDVLSNDGDVSGNHGSYDYWVVKLDGTGNVQWKKTLGGTGEDDANEIQQTSDGGYIVVGSTKSNNGDVSGNHGQSPYNSGGGFDFWAVKLAPVAALPVNLISFTAQIQQNDVITNWETANQLNFSHYEIERSLDATHFEKAGTVQPINGSGVLNYQFKDLNAVNIYKNNGRLFYRLKMVDLDRTTTYSKIVRVDFDKKYTVQVYPNPASKMIHIESDKKLSLIKITDLNGRTIKQFSAVFNNQYDVSSLSKGAYIIFLTGDGETTSVKLIVR